MYMVSENDTGVTHYNFNAHQPILNLSSLFLNELSDGALTTSDGKLFHILTILQLKMYFLKS